ncbi:MAG TPA: alpha/beta fold hydrolase [Candidatus Acidoferrales bacterium]|nr:alpha/beta fold hydrolase [Candidatus Acidoferrales bacterium]
MPEFEPPFLLRNPHLMTIAAAFWHRKFAHLNPTTPRLFETEPGTQVRADCHWQKSPVEHATLILLHGLEGSSDSGYMLGTADKAFHAGFNVLRMNQRNCGGTDDLTPTLYNSGLSRDARAVVCELIERDALPEIFAAGFSMGGNLVLKMAAEFGESAPPELRAVAGICPSCDLGACADAIGELRNRIYERHFVRRLKRRMIHKSKLFPEKYALNGLAKIRSVRQFDNAITAKFCGFRDAHDYYTRSSALGLLAEIRVPALLLVAQDDPMIPFRSFERAKLNANPHIILETPRHGGHCGFIARGGGERFWAEARIVEFCREHSRIAEKLPSHSRL